MCKIWKWWNDVKCRHRTCTETIPLFRISEENESSHPRIQSCSKRFKKLFKRLALSSSETYTVNLVNLNTMDAFLDTTCWHVLDTVASATSQHDTITVNSNYGKKNLSPWEWSLMTTSLIPGKLRGPDHANRAVFWGFSPTNFASNACIHSAWVLP